MSETETLILKEFKQNLIDFIDELIDLYPSEGDLIKLRIFLNDQNDIKETMKTLVFYLNKDGTIYNSTDTALYKLPLISGKTA